MKKRKAKAAKATVKVASYTRKFSAAKLPPRDGKGKWKKKGPRQRSLF